MPATSILAFIVPKLVIQAENAASDCLMFVLSTYPKAAESLIGNLRATGLDLPLPLEFTTQVVWKQGGGRPDILGKSGDDAFLIIEAKFDAPLTKSQPVDYLSCLPNNASGILLFLTPAARVEEIWGALDKRCRRARLVLGERAAYPNGLFAAPLQSGHRLAIASWESLLSWLLHDLSESNDRNAHANLLQLASLCERLLSGELASSSLLGDTDPDKRDRQLRAMVDKVVTGLVEAGHATLKDYRSTPGPGYYKRYMTLSGRKNWCVEFNTEYWARFGESLIWLSGNLVSAADCTALDTGLANSPRRIRKAILIPLLAKHAHSEAEAREQMTVQAATVAKVLASTPPSFGEASGL